MGGLEGVYSVGKIRFDKIRSMKWMCSVEVQDRHMKKSYTNYEKRVKYNKQKIIIIILLLLFSI